MTKSVPLMFDFRESFVFRATEGADHEDSCSCKGGQSTVHLVENGHKWKIIIYKGKV